MCWLVWLFVLSCALLVGQYFVHVAKFMGVGFFFQAEDGIRDLVRSRGLGDVYKRQGASDSGHEQVICRVTIRHPRLEIKSDRAARSARTVSYTHLTLPTIYSV